MQCRLIKEVIINEIYRYCIYRYKTCREREIYIYVYIYGEVKKVYTVELFSTLPYQALEPVRKADVLSKQIGNISGLTLGYKLIS